MNGSSFFSNGLPRKIYISKNEDNSMKQPIVGTWFQNTLVQNSLDESAKIDKRLVGIGQPPLSRQSSVVAKTPLNNKCSSPIKSTLVSLPNDIVTNGYFPQRFNQISNYPRPPSLIYDCNKMTYKHQPTKFDNDENIIPSARKSHFNDINQTEHITTSVIQRINDNLSNVSFNDKYILSFNYLCASAFNHSNAPGRNAIYQPIKPLSETSSIDCLSIKPATKYPSTKIDRVPKYYRESFPYPDPYPKASRSFLNRLTEISILTQNTIRLEKNKNKKSMIKRNSNDLAIVCKD